VGKYEATQLRVVVLPDTPVGAHQKSAREELSQGLSKLGHSFSPCVQWVAAGASICSPGTQRG